MDGSARKDQAALIEDGSIYANLAISDLRAKAFKDAARHIKVVDDLIHRQHQTIRHRQRSIDSIDHK